jgi:hypothetical protein
MDGKTAFDFDGGVTDSPLTDSDMSLLGAASREVLASLPKSYLKCINNNIDDHCRYSRRWAL